MKKQLIPIIVFHLFIVSLIWTQSLSSNTITEKEFLSSRAKEKEYIKSFIYATDGHPSYTIKGEKINSPEMLVRFYRKRNFRPAWNWNKGLLANSEDILKLIKEVDEHGLIPEYYHLDAIKDAVALLQDMQKTGVFPEPEVIAELDLILTDTFLTLGCHFSGRCANHLTAEAEWYANGNDMDVGPILENALMKNTVLETLRRLLPSQESYARLKKSLVFYRMIATNGDLPKVPGSILLKKNPDAYEIKRLKKRLVISGDLTQDNKRDNAVYNKALKQAVIRFQRRHGLNPDGVIGPLTLEAMNVPAETRIRQIELNLERMRWTSGNLGSRYIMINIADYRLDIMENDSSVMSMDVIVGRPYWNTPVMSETMTHIILNPSWKIPDSIAGEELLPRIMENPDILTNKNIKILSSWSNNAEEIDPKTIHWSDITIDDFQYKLRQEPGNTNPLGNIKFMFPNNFNVYLHDTPGKNLFSKNTRSFSHGCIRLSRPFDLAEYLLQNHKGWTRKKLLDSVKTRKKQGIHLPKPIDIHILYLTAWVDEKGNQQFRDDIYGRDEHLYSALLNTAPRLTSASNLTFTIY
ncbi:MAG: L,D-transpeptidase family protein [Thermodesulfovibrionia bacterium]|nr:L,D-transpeptidase family protein [Thermodesulfovibrionia bacterium]